MPFPRKWKSPKAPPPKPVRITHRNLVASVAQIEALGQFGENDTFLGLLPFTHVYGALVGLCLPTRLGARVVTLLRFELFGFLAALGITFADDGFRTPVFDEVTFESARPGVYLAGTVCGGLKTNRWFIENGRFHAQQIAKHLAGQRTEAIPFASIHWKTEE